MVEYEESELPGVGKCFRFATDEGERVQVVAHRTGERDLLVGLREDPDAYRVVVRLSSDESRALAELLTTAIPRD
jgi:K+/H+ antiporter YhaU regulatory subunit KhtT